MDNIFINLSNHPSAKWGNEQRAAAEQYGEVVDLPFPNVPPMAGEEEIEKMADRCVAQIMALAGGKAAVVHIQGEMTLLYAIVSRLKERGMVCLASTSERKVKELRVPDACVYGRCMNALRRCLGLPPRVAYKKVSEFSFVRFRRY